MEQKPSIDSEHPTLRTVNLQGPDPWQRIIHNRGRVSRCAATDGAGGGPSFPRLLRRRGCARHRLSVAGAHRSANGTQRGASSVARVSEIPSWSFSFGYVTGLWYKE